MYRLTKNFYDVEEVCYQTGSTIDKITGRFLVPKRNHCGKNSRRLVPSRHTRRTSLAKIDLCFEIENVNVFSEQDLSVFTIERF